MPEGHIIESEVYDIPLRVRKDAHLKSRAEYDELYKRSIEDPDAFWTEQSKLLDWFQPFAKVSSGTFERGDIAWFLNGKLNVCYNCVDRHLHNNSEKVAIIWEGDTPDQTYSLTYLELHHKICKMANLMKSIGLQKGDTVAIYLPNTPDSAVAMLACARLGIVSSVVFAGFSAESLAARIQDAKCKLVITADEAKRGGKTHYLKKTVDEALLECPAVKHVFVLKRNKDVDLPINTPRDISLTEALARQPLYCPCEPMDSEDPLFVLYTSGSTGTPKGLVHTTAGYILYVMLTFKYVFDYHKGDIFGCLTDIAWITGHSYIVYGPLLNGGTTVVFEGVPTYPSPSRYWEIVDRHNITQLYTAPTVIRTLMQFGTAPVDRFNLSSLRVLGSVGEPINPEAWKWYYDVVGRKECAIVDTYWQTETGGHIIVPIPGAIKTKPGSATLPFFGIEPVVLDSKTGHKLSGRADGALAIAKPWPSFTRTILNDHEKYLQTYLRHYPGYYVTGDGVHRDADGYYWITGRIDDVVNVSGHRIGTAEIEGVLATHASVTEAAVVGFPHELKGQGLAMYCVLAEGAKESPELEHEIHLALRKHIGSLAHPDLLIFCSGLPKTRSGKIMRRILRKIAANETSDLGDTTTLIDPDIVQVLIKKVQAKMHSKIPKARLS